MKAVTYIIISILFCWAIVNVSAYQIGENNLQFTCKIVNPTTGASQIPSDSATFNFTVSSSNGTNILNNVEATSQGQGAFNHSVYFPSADNYIIQEWCYDIAGNSSNQETILVTSNGSLDGVTLLLFLFIGGVVLLVLSMFVEVEELFLFLAGLCFLIGGIYAMSYGFGTSYNWFEIGLGLIGLGLGIVFIISSYLGTIKDDEDEKSWDSQLDDD